MNRLTYARTLKLAETLRKLAGGQTEPMSWRAVAAAAGASVDNVRSVARAAGIRFWRPELRAVAQLRYPIVAIGDVHGQIDALNELIGQLMLRREWNAATFVFLGDLVDRGPDPAAVVERVVQLLTERPGSVCVMGNHDLACVRACGLDGNPPSPYWATRWVGQYDSGATLASYGVVQTAHLRDAMPRKHREFLTSLPWVAEAEGHLFLHNGLSPELLLSAERQVERLRLKRWNVIDCPPGHNETGEKFNPEYPVWLGANRRLSANPLPHPTKVQVTGHVMVARPDANGVRIRIDTSGGNGPLTACILRSATAQPEFVTAGRTSRPAF